MVLIEPELSASIEARKHAAPTHAATVRRIDNLVYELYVLGTEEIRLVEGSAESR